MKKLLMKWFPGYFNVTNIISLDQTEVIAHPYRLAVVDETTHRTFRSLGLDQDRSVELCKKIHALMIEKKDKVAALIALEPEIKHINEFYCVVLYMEDPRMHPGNAKMALLGALFGGLGRPDKD